MVRAPRDHPQFPPAALPALVNLGHHRCVELTHGRREKRAPRLPLPSGTSALSKYWLSSLLSHTHTHTHTHGRLSLLLVLISGKKTRMPLKSRDSRGDAPLYFLVPGWHCTVCTAGCIAGFAGRRRGRRFTAQLFAMRSMATILQHLRALRKKRPWAFSCLLYNYENLPPALPVKPPPRQSSFTARSPLVLETQWSLRRVARALAP